MVDEIKLDPNKIPKQDIPKDGDWVIMTNCAESKQIDQPVFKVKGDAFRGGGGEVAVMLEGYSGYFLAKYLKPIRIETTPFMDQIVKQIKFNEDDDWDNYSQHFNLSVLVRHRKNKVNLAIGICKPSDEHCEDCGYYRNEGRGD